MEQIGFKNFRKFKDFPPLRLSPITIFVGENNAGKSTVVKGILALADFLNEPRNVELDAFDGVADENKKQIVEKAKSVLKNIKFYFNTSYLAHIGTFKRALYNKAENPVISFFVDFGELSISIDVTGNSKDEESVSGIVSTVEMHNSLYKIDASFDLIHDKASVTFNPGNEDIDIPANANGRLKGLRNFLLSFNKPVTFCTDITSNCDFFRRSLLISLVSSLEESLNASIEEQDNVSDQDDHINNHWSRYFEPIEGLSHDDKKFLIRFRDSVPNVMPSRYEFKRLRLPLLNGATVPSYRLMNIEYLYAHAVSQTVLYSAKDTNDYLSRTIHEFASEKYSQYKHDFIVDWMKKFHVGTNYSIKSVGGEAHLVYITNFDGEKVNLADKGMGSIQLMVLLFRLAINLPSNGRRTPRQFFRSRFNKIIIIEEPEQNLHPMLQSKLADLFYQLNKDFGFRFIIETHSEYLIRRSQVIVGDNNYKDKAEMEKENPFKVYYFPSDGVPYDMEYTLSGMFERKFGEGFINEAGRLHMEVLKNAQKRG